MNTFFQTINRAVCLVVLSMVLHASVSLAFAQSDDPPAPPPEKKAVPILIKNATIIDGTGRAPYVASVLVEGKQITRIIKGDIVPVSQAEIVDAKGQYLIPGFIDVMSHLSLRSHLSANMKDFDSGKLDDLYRDVSEKDAQKRLKQYTTILKETLRSGVTTLVDSITSVADSEMIKQAINENDFPNYFSLGPILGYKGGHPYPVDSTVDPKDLNAGWKYVLPELNEKTTADDRDAALSILKSDLTKFVRDAGLAGLTVAVDLPAENGHPVARVPFDTLKTICGVAKEFKKPVFFMSSSDEGIQEAVNAGANVEVGPPIVMSELGFQAARRDTLDMIANSKVTVLSLESALGGRLEDYTSAISKFMIDVIKNPAVPKDTVENYVGLLKHYQNDKDTDPERATFVKNIDGHMTLFSLAHNLNASLFNQDHVNVIPTGDEGMPWSFHGGFPRELGILSSRGAQGASNAVMTPMELIQAATLKAASTMNLQDSLGSIEAGKTADLLLLDANPLDNINNVRRIVHVIKGGKILNF